MLDKLSKDQEVNPMAGDKKTIDIKKNQSSNAVIESSESKIAPKVNVSIKRKNVSARYYLKESRVFSFN